jgi:methyl-accepting chemotaxis protein
MKIGGGFFVLSVLILVVGLISYFSLQDSSKGFETYRVMARTTGAIGMGQSDILDMRTKVSDYIAHADEEDLRQYRIHIESARKNIDIASNLLNDVDHRRALSTSLTRLEEYDAHFTRLVKLTRKYAENYDLMVENGNSLKNSLRQVIESSQSTQEVRGWVLEILSYLLETRLNIMKFTLDRDVKFKAMADETVEKLFDLLDSERGHSMKEFTEQARQQVENYRKAMDGNLNLQISLNREVSESLDVIGPEINNILEERLFTIKALQDAMGPRLMAENNSSILRIFWLVFSAVLAGILFGILITRGITGPVFKAVEMAGSIRLGDVSRRVDILTSDEIGDLGKALNSMADNLEEKVSVLEAVSSGDLTRTVKLASEQDVFGKSLNRMTRKLQQVMSDILDMAEHSDSSASQLADASQSLSQGASEQASSIEEITSSITQIGSQARTNSENADQATRLAVAAKESADKGNVDMNRMIGSMHKIGDSSQKMASVIKAIDEIAFQTNLLALNAAVEAARAGKYGKGFAVVAQEVRDLAGRSARAAHETAELIESSISQIAEGSDIAGATAASLGEINNSVVRAADLVEEIAAASREQATGIHQIIQALSQIEIVTQQSTASAEETASAAEEIAGQATTLKEQVEQFRI